MSSEKRKIAYIDGKPYEIGANHTSICLLYTSDAADE